MNNKINYEKINWKAGTYWEFCGSFENLLTVWDRYRVYIGRRPEIEVFGYKPPCIGLAFEKGDVVRLGAADENPTLGVVDTPVYGSGLFRVLTSDGRKLVLRQDLIGDYVVPSKIPDELMALARAEATAASIDLSRCPLKNAGACMETKQ